MKTKKNIVKMVTISILTAITIVLQAVGSNIHFGPYSPALALIPITIGAILFGPLAGTWLGFVFGLVILFSPDCTTFYAISIPGTVITVLGKGSIAGLAVGWIYKGLKRYNPIVAIIVASLFTPIVNSVLFRVGIVTFFYQMLSSSATKNNASTFVYLFIGLTGVNFFVEFGINAVLSPVIARICQQGARQLHLDDEKIFDAQAEKRSMKKNKKEEI